MTTARIALPDTSTPELSMNGQLTGEESAPARQLRKHLLRLAALDIRPRYSSSRVSHTKSRIPILTGVVALQLIFFFLDLRAR